MALPSYNTTEAPIASAESSKEATARKIEDFWTAYTVYREAVDSFKRVYVDSQDLLRVDTATVSDPELQQKLSVIQEMYQGNGGA